jgi:hypothetical protein
VKHCKVTITLSDNPLAGMPGQNDLTIVVSGEPDLPLGPDGAFPPVEDLPMSIIAAVEMLSHLTGQVHETVYLTMARGEFGG